MTMTSKPPDDAASAAPLAQEEIPQAQGLRIVRPYLAWDRQGGVAEAEGYTPPPDLPERPRNPTHRVAFRDDDAPQGEEIRGTGTQLNEADPINVPAHGIEAAELVRGVGGVGDAALIVPSATKPPAVEAANTSTESQPKDASAIGDAAEENVQSPSAVETAWIHQGAGGSQASSVVALSVDSGEVRDSADDETDSAIGDASIYTTSTSVKSSVYRFIEENGRTYHAYREGKYYLPNDEVEQDRLDLQHHLFLLTLSGELYNAPIKDLPGGIHNALDIATGTGIWAIEFAYQFPSANVIGTDLSPIQPQFTPPNLHFEVDDAEDPWLYSHQFDYIHGRALATCFKSHQLVINSAFSFTRSGGYFELQDCIIPFQCIDDSVVGTSVERWVSLIIEGTTRLGKDWTQVRHYKEYLERAGFVDVEERRYEWPVGTWARGKRNKTLGTWYREDLLSGLQGFTIAVLTRGLGMSTQEVEVLLVGVREELRSNRIHIYIPVRVVFGRKP